MEFLCKHATSKVSSFTYLPMSEIDFRNFKSPKFILYVHTRLEILWASHKENSERIITKSPCKVQKFVFSWSCLYRQVTLGTLDTQSWLFTQTLFHDFFLVDTTLIGMDMKFLWNFRESLRHFNFYVTTNT